MDIIILTDKVNLSKPSSSIGGLTGYIEDAILKDSLKEQGLTVDRKTWDDPDVDWSQTKAIIFRSTWDYFYRFNEFQPWLEKVSQQTQLINSKNLIIWNVDKHYLYDLKEKGIHIVPSYFIEKGSKESLAKIHENLNWDKTVLKPCVSGTARHTYVLEPSTLEKHQSTFEHLLQNESMILQPFQKDIVLRGEVSIVVINGQYTHAVLKKANQGDFRVQEDFGGTYTNYQPTPQEISFAEKAIADCREIPLYARVDIINDNNGQIALAELELIEPELWLRENTIASELLAKAIVSTYF